MWILLTGLCATAVPAVAWAQVNEAAAVEAELVEPLPDPPELVLDQPEQPRMGAAGFFLGVNTLVGVGRSSGAYGGGRADLGLRIRNRTRHLGVDIRLGMGSGRLRRFTGRDRATEMAVGMEFRGYVNPQHPFQLFVAGGFGVGIVSVGDHEAPSTAECPSVAMFFADLSAGVGFAFPVSKIATLSTTVSVVRRTSSGDLTFVERTVNPPLRESDLLIGVSAQVVLVGYLSGLHPTN
ncbi:MAG: hypothetical protein JJ863_34755 [Deltaproteobacteria bacterium]|nr:hypothetical protein [Deltaproteobacteria bacterium]